MPRLRNFIDDARYLAAAAFDGDRLQDRDLPEPIRETNLIGWCVVVGVPALIVGLVVIL
jgi:hypothetical protein